MSWPCSPTAGSWRRQELPAAIADGTGGQVEALGASSAANAWVFTFSAAGPAEAVRWDGAQWTASALPAWAYVTNSLHALNLAAGVFSRSNVWLFSKFLDAARPYAAHWNGTQWIKRRLPVDPYQVSAVSRANIWMAGLIPGSVPSGVFRYAAAHWNGRSWRLVRLPRGDVPGELSPFNNADNMAATGTRRVCLVADRRSGKTVLLHRAGGRWHRVRVPVRPRRAAAGLVADGHGGAWLQLIESQQRAAPLLYHYRPGRWSRHPVPVYRGGEMQLDGLAWVPGTRSAWAAGASLSPRKGPAAGKAVILGNGH